MILTNFLRDREEEITEKLFHVRNTLLESLNCGHGNCSKVVIFSDGPSGFRHPARFGVYTLTTTYQGYPVYSRAVSRQFLFYQREFEKWEYAHRIERWIPS